MEKDELIKRAEDLSARCDRQSKLTSTNFLTPGERAELERWGVHAPVVPYFSGGREECERTIAFFLPYYMDSDTFVPDEYIDAIHITAHFGSPEHRDYMGALLGMGIGREWLGDIMVNGSEAYIFCVPSVSEHLMGIDKVGRCGVTAEKIALSAVPEPKREMKRVSFSVMSLRLDAVAAGMFSLSRTEAAKRIAAGLVTVNYLPCLKPDMLLSEGTVVSVRGAGKAKLIGTGGTSRKGRLFVYADIYK